jgi:hypothetical protein
VLPNSSSHVCSSPIRYRSGEPLNPTLRAKRRHSARPGSTVAFGAVTSMLSLRGRT